MAAAWVALEDVTPDNGPLHYYPSSHKLPCYLNADYQNEGTNWLIGNKECTEYEAHINQKIAGAGIPRRVFLASKGDVFVWHANLMRGGEPHLGKFQTRKSMVFHYFSQARICHHKITQRLGLLLKDNCIKKTVMLSAVEAFLPLQQFYQSGLLLQ